MDTLRLTTDLRSAIDRYDAERRNALGCIKALIADMMERGKTLSEIDAYLSSDPFTMIGVSLPQDLVRTALEIP